MRRAVGVSALATVLSISAIALVSHARMGSATVSPCAAPGALQATTARYTMGLLVGPVETMYTQSQASAQHPTSGEVMLGGTMSNLPGMATGGSMPGGTGAPAASGQVWHLEVHICSKDTGQVVQNANPVITVLDTTAGGMPRTIPVAVMEGVGQGLADLHYGNNVTMPAGHTFLVTVAPGADRAAYELTMGPQGMVWGAPTTAPVAAAAAPPRAAAPRTAAPPSGMGSATAQMPPPAMPPASGAPTPRTGVLTSAAPAAGGGIAFIGVVLWVMARRRRPEPMRLARVAWRTPSERPGTPARRSGGRHGTTGRR
jgi:hypothetical protein